MMKKEIALLDFIDKMEQMGQFQDRLDVSSSMNQIWEVFLEEIRKYIIVDVCALFLVDDKTHEFMLNKTFPENKENICKKEVEYQIECDMFSWIINRRKPAIIPSFIFKGKKSIIMLPLSTVKRTIGVILILTPITESMITHENLKLMTMLSRQCSLVMENSLLYGRIREKHEALLKAQDKIIQSEKMASIGRLTSGASHEILNPLSIISGNIQLMLMKHDFDEGIQRTMEVIQKQTDRIGRIIKGLAEFSRHSSSDKKVLEINALIEKFLINSQQSDKEVDIKKDLSQKLPEIFGCEKSLLQLLSFLMSNALDAIDKEGVVKLRTCYNGYKSHDEDRNHYIRVTFEDNGCGIPEENLPKVLDPFFTTRQAEYRIGLGLSLAYSIIQDHGGWMEIDSKQEKGTTVQIYLPVLKKS